MNWEITSVIAEWVGAISVIASLLYLARQIKLTNLQSQASARYSFLEAYGQANAAVAASNQTASVFRRGLLNELSNDDEKMHFMVLAGQFLNTWSVMYDLHQEGQLPESQWHLVSTDIHTCLITTGGKKFWKEIGNYNVHPLFATYVNSLLQDQKPNYSVIPTKNS